jgi:hypothetical protein
MLALAKTTSSNKSESNSKISLEEATNYLKKIKEWESASKFDRETIIAWAEFLKNKGVRE